MRRVRARFKRRSRPSISSAVSFGISARSRSGHDFSRVLEVMSPRKNRSTRSVTRIFLTMPVLLPSFRDSFPAVLAVKVSLRRGSAATLTAAGCGESVPATEGSIAREPTGLLMASPHRKAASPEENVPQNGHQTAAPSALLPWPHGELLVHSSAECHGGDRHPPTIPGADDAPTRSDSQARFLLTPIFAVASDSAFPACPIPRPPAPRGAPPSRSFLAPQISSGARP